MGDAGRRYDTVEIDTSKHLPQKERRKRNRRSHREPRIPRWVYKIIVILILCVVSMLVWFNRSNLTPENVLDWVHDSVVGMGIGDGFPSKIVGNSVAVGNFKSVNKEIYVLSDTALTVLNSTAKAVSSRQHSYSQPVMKVSGNRILIYNLGGKGYQLESQSGTLVKSTAQKNILAGALAGNGRYALVTEADGYLGCLTAYNTKNKAMFRYWFSDYYPAAVALNYDGTKAAVAAVGTKDGGMNSAVYLFDFNENKTVTPVAAYAENMMLDISWSDKDTVSAVGDRLTSVIDAGSRTKTDYDYQGMQLKAYCMDSGRTALGLSAFGNTQSGRLVVLNASGSVTANNTLEQDPVSVSLYGDTAAALSQGKVRFYSASTGRPAGSCAAGSDARAISLHNETSVYILGVSEIRYASAK
ncbi:hypothetical protein FL966_07095 [Caproiciproducens galactitolivorans]|uniref:Protein TolB n=1 Tax=Caproiciproducens galactitolivorans TaxID=642589 RepID=A0A4Z0XWY7_9FIRM|nr:DUF5711 family protein [Caproiciproducens galactitolivorans]QEY34836.1 hypothetical protein FL966_07095 [Caproiciproducens galactitolivorans]TGJ75914.1 hypothetical protein CAGA_18800 [Caproiciproducens galactitolivorans]